MPRSKSAPEKTIIYLAFSGGGTRAAAFAYGVLEELRATEIRDGDGTANLLGEVDTISGVSGGSFPAAYYAAFGDRIFEDFESRFLKKNVTLALLIRALLPWNFVRILGPVLSRSDLARQYYDEKIFDGATFGDLMDSQGPRLYINATDLSSGRRFTFTQDTFDVICSDLEALSLGTAVAASSAVPLLLSPITIKNHAGTCGYEPPISVGSLVPRATCTGTRTSASPAAPGREMPMISTSNCSSAQAFRILLAGASSTSTRRVTSAA